MTPGAVRSILKSNRRVPMKRLAVAAAAFIAFATGALPARADRAEAERFYLEGNKLFNDRQYPEAIEKFTKSIEADPTYARARAFRAWAKDHALIPGNGLEDIAIALEMEPKNPVFLQVRIQIYMGLDRTTEAIEDGEELVRLKPDDPTNGVLLGLALVRSGEIDLGFEKMTKALEASGNDPNLYVRGDVFRAKADWQGMLDETEVLYGAGRKEGAVILNRVIALTELGEYAKAQEAIKDAEPDTSTWGAVRAYLAATPKAGALFDPRQAFTMAQAAVEGREDSGLQCVLARTLYLTGQPIACLDLLSTKGRRTHFETMFWLGASYWKLGKFPEAIDVLKEARRLNPYLIRHAEALDAGFKEFVAGIDKELVAETGDRGRLGFERATHLMTVAEIEALVRRYRFDRAAAEYALILPTLKSAIRKAEIETRLPEVKGMAGAHAKLIAAVTKAPGKMKVKLGKTELTIAKADAAAFDFKIPGGEGKFPWAFLDPAAYGELAAAQDLTPEELLGLGCLLWDAGLPVAAMKHFDSATKKQAALKKNLTAFIARKRGIPAPDGGFVAFRGSYATPEEKANLEKGLLLFGGKWVPAKDKEQLAKGFIQIDGKWVPGEEAKLREQGFCKYKDKWMSREDYEALRSGWEDAYTETTTHFQIRTNEGEQFAKDLALLVEAAYLECKAFYGGAEPKFTGGETMTLFAFRTYEDYRKYCAETKTENHLGAAGFARSDSNTVVGWNKTSNRQQFLQTMVHEMSHLYYFRVSPAAHAPSWYAESMATYFEGFTWDGKAYKFTFVSESRLPFVRDAMKGKRHIPLKDMLSGDALALINSDSQKALLFYAECWSLNYFLSNTDSKPYREAWAEYRKSVAGGGAKTLLEFFPDAARLEADWVRFVTGL
jgi:tetratricopeptide (TPR) repeat protein